MKRTKILLKHMFKLLINIHNFKTLKSNITLNNTMKSKFWN